MPDVTVGKENSGPIELYERTRTGLGGTPVTSWRSGPGACSRRKGCNNCWSLGRSRLCRRQWSERSELKAPGPMVRQLLCPSCGELRMGETVP